MTKGIFIIGTDTDVGKTHLCALIAKNMKGKSLAYYKAALSGATVQGDRLIPGDGAYVMREGGLEGDPLDFISYIFEEALSPHLAAERQGIEIKLSKIRKDFSRLKEKYDFLLVEGSGGIICPLTRDKLLLEDVILALGLEVILVSTSGLGAINASLLTCHYLKARKITCRGIILNRFDENSVIHRDNLQMIESMTGIPIIATVAEKGDLNFRQGNIKDIWGGIDD